MPVPKKILLHRIIHIDNLKYILDVGKLTCPNHTERDVNYIGIGDTSLIGNRSRKQLTLPPYGTFNDYLAFYFTNRSPMLYEIAHGYNNVKQRDQKNIIYLVTSYKKIKVSHQPFLFFDGHGYHNVSGCYNDDKNLDQVDWNAVKAKFWSDPENDSDLKRRKQAELIVHQELSIEFLIGIGAYSGDVKERIDSEISKRSVNLECKVKTDWYY